MNLNDVKIAGNLVQEPELHYTPQGTPVTNVSLGVNETYTLNNRSKDQKDEICDPLCGNRSQLVREY